MTDGGLVVLDDAALKDHFALRGSDELDPRAAIVDGAARQVVPGDGVGQRDGDGGSDAQPGREGGVEQLLTRAASSAPASGGRSIPGAEWSWTVRTGMGTTLGAVAASPCVPLM